MKMLMAHVIGKAQEKQSRENLRDVGVAKDLFAVAG